MVKLTIVIPAVADPEASTRSLAPSSVKHTGPSTDETKASSSLSPPALSESGPIVSSTVAPTPPPKDSSISLPVSSSKPLSDPIETSPIKTSNDAASSTISDISSSSSIGAIGGGNTGSSGASGTISDGSGDEYEGALKDGEGKKKKKAKRLVQKVKGKLHIGH